jgi:hypothetical protein
MVVGCKRAKGYTWLNITLGLDTIHLTASVDLDARIGVIYANALMTTSNMEDRDYILELFATDVESVSICFLTRKRT